MEAADRQWWGLPGPARFLERVAQAALASPEGVVGLSLPRVVPAGILPALADTLEEATSTKPVRVDASRGLGGRQPLRVLANVAGVDTSGFRQSSDFLDDPSIADTVFLIHGIRPEDWLSWSLFFRTFRLERAELARMSAPVLVVVPPSGLPPSDIRAALGERVLRWMDVVSRLDTRLYAEQLHGGPGDSLIARTALETSIEFAGWDPEMLRLLVGLPYEQQLDPVPLLREAAKTKTREPLTPSWENALVDQWDGLPHVHMLALIKAGQEAALRDRLWSARVRVVFPFIEMVRHAVIAKYEPFLCQRLPFNKERPHRPEPDVWRESHQIEWYELRTWLRGTIPSHEDLLLRECYALRRAMAHADPGNPLNIGNVSSLWDNVSHSFPPNCPGWDWPRCGQELVLMVGPSGAGKSTYARAHYAHEEIVSSDAIRMELNGSLGFNGDQRPVFERVRQRAVGRLAAGQRVVIDATHGKTPDRLINALLVPADIPVEYVVIDRPMEDKRRDGGWRLERDVLDIHAQQFAASLPDILACDGLSNVRLNVPSLDGRNPVTDARAEHAQRMKAAQELSQPEEDAEERRSAA